VLGLNENVLRPMKGVRVMLTALETPFRCAETVRVAVKLSRIEPIVKGAELEPSGTVTLAGTISADEFELRLTVEPPVRAEPESWTWPTLELPLIIVVGFAVSPVSRGTARMVTLAERVTEPKLAKIWRVASEPTRTDVTVKLADEAPLTRVTLAGTCRAELPEVRLTVVAAGAGPVR
jgi:hypothetical protein